jgi:hypothetical protein
MWKSSEKRIQEQFHPKHLYHFLESVKDDYNNEALHTFLDAW